MKVLKLRLEQSAAKLDPPFVYNGEPDFNKFQKWVLETKDWLRLSYIRKNHRVSRLKKYLGGRAYSFYMRDIARNPRKWSLRRFLEELFNHCFPPDFRTVQRERFLSFQQNGRTVRDFRRRLDELTLSVGHISRRELTLRFWHGADRYLRVRWAEDGFDPEKAKIDELQAAAERYEQA
ncbi:hypothetical protein NEOLEDRAFT_1073240, partial [Neolentinus lepideus HHB14362 ss-1]